MKTFLKIIKNILKVLFAILLVLVIVSSTILYSKYVEYRKKFNDNSIKEKIEKIKTEIMYEKLENIDKKYITAVLEAEDHRFYNHGAIDIISIFRAAKINLKQKKLIEGGSSITQQVAKNVFLTQETSFERKITEIFLAMDIERIYKKDDILEIYVNTSYFGSGYYCIKEASFGYFGKSPKSLSKLEAIFLAGVPNAPSVYDPRVNEELAEARKKQVIYKMLRRNKLTEEEAEQLRNEKIKVLDREKGNEILRKEKQLLKEKNK